MRFFGLTAWRTLVVQSLALFSLFLGLGLGLLAAGFLWRRARWRRHSRYTRAKVAG